jgi:hypothetical protein
MADSLLAFSKHDVFLGRTADGERVYVDVELWRKHSVAPHEWRKHSVAPHETIEHQPVNLYTELVISGETYRKHSRYVTNVDQVDGTAAAIVDPAPGWTLEDIRDLVTIWRRYHLNGARAGCAHQVIERETRYGRSVPSLDKTAPCPITGYRYGHAWLVELLPAEVKARVRELVERCDSKEGAHAEREDHTRVD